jgi:DNA-directed RNA polymerase subunit beta
VVDAGDILAGPLDRWANSRSAATASSRSCRGTATTSVDLISNIVKDDIVHLDRGIWLWPRDTSWGQRDITHRDIPNVGEEALRSLDEARIVYIGARSASGRHSGGGKITPGVNRR